MKTHSNSRKRRWRLGRAGFLLAALPLALSWVPGLGLLGGPLFGPFLLALAGLWSCAFSLRLRHMGSSVWFQVMPMAVTVALLGWSFITATVEGQDQAYPVLATSLQGIAVIWLAFLGWLALTPGAPPRRTR